MKYIIIFITTPSKEEANKIAGRLVNKRLVACVNILPCASIFSWKNKIERLKEWLLIAKSTEKQLNKIIKAVRGLHSYQVPEVIAMPIIGGSKKYLEWVKDETK